MYLLATHIPIHTDGTRHFTDISWQRDLILARDWLARPYGGLTLIAPSLPVYSTTEQGMGLVPIGLDDAGCVTFLRSMPAAVRVISSTSRNDFAPNGRAKFGLRDLKWSALSFAQRQDAHMNHVL